MADVRCMVFWMKYEFQTPFATAVISPQALFFPQIQIQWPFTILMKTTEQPPTTAAETGTMVPLLVPNGRRNRLDEKRNQPLNENGSDEL